MRLNLCRSLEWSFKTSTTYRCFQRNRPAWLITELNCARICHFSCIYLARVSLVLFQKQLFCVVRHRFLCQLCGEAPVKSSVRLHSLPCQRHSIDLTFRTADDDVKSPRSGRSALFTRHLRSQKRANIQLENTSQLRQTGTKNDNL